MLSQPPSPSAAERHLSLEPTRTVHDQTSNDSPRERWRYGHPLRYAPRTPEADGRRHAAADIRTTAPSAEHHSDRRVALRSRRAERDIRSGVDESQALHLRRLPEQQGQRVDASAVRRLISLRPNAGPWPKPAGQAIGRAGGRMGNGPNVMGAGGATVRPSAARPSLNHFTWPAERGRVWASRAICCAMASEEGFSMPLPIKACAIAMWCAQGPIALLPASGSTRRAGRVPPVPLAPVCLLISSHPCGGPWGNQGLCSLRHGEHGAAFSYRESSSIDMTRTGACQRLRLSREMRRATPLALKFR